MKKIYYFCCLLFFALCSLDAVVGDMTFSEATQESDNKEYIHIEKDGKHFWGIFDVSLSKDMKIEESYLGKHFSIIFDKEADLKANLNKVIEYLSSKIEELLKQDTVDENKISNVFYNARKHFKINLDKCSTLGRFKYFVPDGNLEKYLFNINYGVDFEYDEDTETLDNIRIGGVGFFYIPKKENDLEVYWFSSGEAVNLVKVGEIVKVRNRFSNTKSKTMKSGGYLIGFEDVRQVLNFEKWNLEFAEDNYFIINDLGEYINKRYDRSISIEDVDGKTAEEVRAIIKDYFSESVDLVEPDNVVFIKIEGEQTFRDWAMMWLKEHPKTFRLIKFFGMTAVVTGLYLAYKKFTSGS